MHTYKHNLDLTLTLTMIQPASSGCIGRATLRCHSDLFWAATTASGPGDSHP